LTLAGGNIIGSADFDAHAIRRASGREILKDSGLKQTIGDIHPLAIERFKNCSCPVYVDERPSLS
jgi:hypothetical protein